MRTARELTQTFDMNTTIKSDRRRVVITGMGAMTPLGESVSEFWQGLVDGQSGIDQMQITDPT